MANLSAGNIDLYDFFTGKLVCQISIPAPAVNLSVPEVWTDKQLDDWIDLERLS